MKKWLQGIGIGALALGLAACGSAAEPKTDSATGEKVEVTNKSDMTAQEVYSKAMAVSDEVKSMHAVMDIDQTMTIPGQDMTLDSKIKMDMGELGASDMELYMTEAGFFMYDEQMDQWIQMPNDMYEEMMESMGGETDPTLDMKMFKEFQDDFKFEQTNDEYILTLNASGDKLNGLIKQLIGDAMPIDGAMSEEEAEVFDNMDVKSLDLTIYIDKKTFYTNAFDMDMDLTMKVEEEEMHMVQKMKSVMTKINEVDEIVIPQKVLDEAVDLEELMGQEG